MEASPKFIVLPCGTRVNIYCVSSYGPALDDSGRTDILMADGSTVSTNITPKDIDWGIKSLLNAQEPVVFWNLYIETKKGMTSR